LPGTIVARGETGSMRGYPVARATGPRGSWVYTLYTPITGEPFIHALNTVTKSAACIDLPGVAPRNIWETRLSLSPDGHRLRVRSGGKSLATVDVKTLRLL
jgi:hypothetical protein